MMFVKGYDKQGGKRLRFHLHMAPENHHLWERLLFRDYLIKHPQTAKDYEKLKYQLASVHRNDREAYTDGKENFVIAVTQKAKLFFK